MNAIKFLINEHNQVRRLLSELLDPTHREETQKKIFDTLHSELLRHEKMEQTIWYPQLKLNKTLTNEIKHLKDEEHHAKKFMERLDKIKNSDHWQDELYKLQQDVEHHAD